VSQTHSVVADTKTGRMLREHGVRRGLLLLLGETTEIAGSD
jgi:hypothetical protein